MGRSGERCEGCEWGGVGEGVRDVSVKKCGRGMSVEELGDCGGE